MNTEGHLAALDLAAKIARTVPPKTIQTSDIGYNVSKLSRLAVSLHKRYEAACNYPHAATEVYENTTKSLEARALEVARKLGIKLEFNRDPRGWPFLIVVGDYDLRLG